MFNKMGKSELFGSEKIDTLIGENTHFEGTLKAEGNVRVNGTITGELVVTGNVIIGDSCTIKGNIKAENAYIAGTVNGNITATGQLHMTPTAKVLGDIVVKNIIVDEGAIFNGHCKAIVDDGVNSEKFNIA